MVARKAVPPLATSQSPSSPTNPPYPTSPPSAKASTLNSAGVYSADLRTSPAFDLIDMREAQQRARSNSDSSHGTWDSEGSGKEDDGDKPTESVDVPKPLDTGNAQQNMNGQSAADQKNELPPSLRIGPAKPSISTSAHGYEDEAQANPWKHESTPRTPSNPKNPYLKQNGFVGENSQAAWQEVAPPVSPAYAPPPPPVNAPPAAPSAPVELPTTKSPTQELESLSFGVNRAASWETAEILAVPHQGQPSSTPGSDQQSRPVSTWWNDSEHEHEHEHENQSAFAPPPHPPPKQLQQAEQYQPPRGPPPGRTGTLIDHEDAPSRSFQPVSVQAPDGSSSESPATAAGSTGNLLQKQRNTTYQIKHINWLDETYNADNRTRSTLRNSPILTQNANGPCPLLALVNALVLTTPLDLDTSLIQVLSDREQISLGLLLDGVFDELMSQRRAGGSEKLPDVTELYSFLLALHTGMNVNPRFVTPATTPRGSWDGVPATMSGMHPLHKAQHKAGAFEETKEMRLYSTFNIPLIHGWTPPVDTPAYEAFVRSAQTFEDAQNIQFAESELETKRSVEGLTQQEAQTLQDIQTIKAFLNTWPTQLTDYGLETMAKSLLPGQFAILFRNDHFSTIYKEPRHGALMTLITDAGYGTHDEIVWESLVDVNGAASEMFSGDFRIVSHGQDVRFNQANSAGGTEGWTTVQGRGKGSLNPASSSPPPPPLPGPRPSQVPSAQNDDIPVQMTEEQRKAAEQEDHDLALAMQLQEEEEAREREAEQRRKREQELSEQFLSNEGDGPRPPIPPRRSGGRAAAAANGSGASPSGRPTVTIPVTTSANPPSATRPPVNRPGDDQNDPDAPPSYEQAWSDRPYRPAGSTAPAVLSQGNAIGAYDALRRQSYGQSGYAMQSNSSLPSFDQAGPASPPYSVVSNRRRPETQNQNVRRQSQMGFSVGPQRTTQIGRSVPPQRSLIGQGGLSPGHYPGSMQARSAERLRNHQAPIVRDAEDKCVVM